MKDDTMFQDLLNELQYDCPLCNGWGDLYIIKKAKNNKKVKMPCPECSGSGKVGVKAINTVFSHGVSKYKNLIKLWAKANEYELIERRRD